MRLNPALVISDDVEQVYRHLAFPFTRNVGRIESMIKPRVIPEKDVESILKAVLRRSHIHLPS